MALLARSIVVLASLVVVSKSALADPEPDSPTAWGPPVPPSVLPFDGFEVPAGYHVESRARKAPIIVGGVLLGVFYGLPLAFAVQKDASSETHWLAAPIIGPWAAANQHADSCAHRSPDDSYCVDLAPLGYAIVGLGQLAGAITLSAGLLNPRQVLVRNRGSVSSQPTHDASIAIMPWVTSSGAGLAVGGLL